MWNKEITKDHIFLYYNGQLIYKSYRNTDERSWVFGTPSQGGAFKIG